MTEQPNNDPQLLFVPPGSIENLVGTTFYKKKGHSDKDKETLFQVENCGVEEFKHTHKYLALLFSAGWCPPCKTFLSILKEFYSEVNIESK
jgi:thiol-disulfide isomerase/thioredoxin